MYLRIRYPMTYEFVLVKGIVVTRWSPGSHADADTRVEAAAPRAWEDCRTFASRAR